MAASSAGRPFNIQTIEIMYKSKMKPDEIIEHLLKCFKTFNRLINNDRLPDDTLSLLVHIIAQASTCSSQLKRQDVFNLLQKVSESKLLNLTGCRLLFGVACTNKDTHSFPCILSDFVTILQELVLRMPNLCTTPQIIGLVNVLNGKISECDQLDAKTSIRDDILQIKKDIISAVEERSKSLHTRRSKNREDGWIPPEYFKELSIMPSEQDLFFPVNFLRRNKSVGKYMDLDHYLDVQFRLYREDCISPLRDALSEFLVKQKENRRFRLENGLIYRDVQIVQQKTSLDSGEVFEIKLDKEHCRRINLIKSKRLIYGSLLLLSFDFFKTISLAVVAECDRETLQKKGCFSVQIFRSRNKEKLPKQTNGIMIEAASAYFEAYRHVLKALQAINQATFPFQKHLVSCETDINRPKYLTADSTYDLGPVITESRIELQQNQNIINRTKEKQKREVRLFRGSAWPTKTELRMDESQRQAFISALTKEFVLIQGPPGTGKTYLGLQIAKALLHNSCNWEDTNTDTDVVNITPDINKRKREPRKPCMLVVCYSNHALDQFVEGIIDFMPLESKRSLYPNVVRFGRRCQNPKVAEFSIQNVKMNVRRQFRDPRFGVLETAMDIKKRIKEIRELLELVINRNIVLSFNTMQCALDERHRNNFGNSDRNQAWLQWLHVSEQSWFKEVNKQYQNQDIGIEVQVNTPVVNNEHELFVNVVSEAEYAFNERYFEVDDVEVKLQIESVGLDLEKQLDLQFERKPQLEKKCLRILQTEKEKAEREIHHGQCMAEDNASGLANLWKLNMEDRWKMYRYWLKKFINIQHEQLQNNEKRYIEIFEEYTRASRELDEAIMSNTTVIAMTTTNAARYNESLNKVGPTVTIVEEAAEVPEPHIIAAINQKCQHVILIGDHKQLEPKPAVYKLAKEFNLSVSLFERMLNNKLGYHCLQRQHRMRPEISALVRHIYPVLEDNENVCMYQPIQGVRRSLYFISHEKEETFREEGRSFSNNYEAEYLKELCLYLTKQGYKQTEITIIAAYSGQMYCIREKMPKATFGGVNICILDNYQGEENEIILISLVRSNKNGDIGFLNRENRICVALSRAKQGLYIIGNRTTLTKRSSPWNTVFKTLDKVDKINTHDNNYSTFSFCGKALPLYCQNHPQNDGILAKSPNDFLKAPAGGCELKCDFRLDCGHACRLKCHPIDKEHTKYKCEKLCLKRCKEDHECKRTCHYGANCECNVIMVRELKCSHIVNLDCYINISEYKCIVDVSRTILCGHPATMKCHTNPDDFVCHVIIERTLKCGHRATMKCHINPDEFTCQVTVERTLKCGHSAELRCHLDPEMHKCNEVITETRSKCGHSFTRQCYDTRYERLNSCKTVIVDQRSKCNHEFEHQCHDTMYEVHNNCKVVITRERSPCKHMYQRQCFDIMFEKRLKCKEFLTEKWPLCDHSYQRQCFDKEFSSRFKCEVNVQKIFPVCGHEISLPCHVNITTINCKESISTQFSCGHSITHKCYESGTIVCSSKCHKICKNGHICNRTCHVPNPCNCQILVEVVLLNCRHKQNIPCSTDENDFDCVETVTKIRPVCGHKQRMMCHMDPKDFKCMSSVLKPFPDCEHKKIVACFAPITGFNCCKEVEIILDRCKHTAKVECWEKESETLTVECKATISYIRPECGHTMDIKCFEKDAKKKFPPCKTLVNTHLKCGHISKRVCSKHSQEQTCERKCEKLLLCGHPCPKLCQACQDDYRHGECRQSCDKELLCGHQCCSELCMNCSPCQKACSYSCSHTVCARECCDPCKPCKKKCSWQCPHFKCTNSCDEICNRPRCKNHCKKTLLCGHRCTGYCGEPCPDSCIKCKPTIYILSDMSKVDRTVTLLQCGHTFNCRFLDEYIHKRSSNILSRCPSCKIIIQCHPRYNDILKRNKALLEETKQNILDRIPPRSKVVFPACIPSYAQDVERYSRSLATFLQIVRCIGSEADILEIIHLAENLIKDIKWEIGNKAKDNFQHWLNISHKAFLMYIYWMVCLMSTKSDILSKTYVISNITTSTLQMVDNMNGPCPSSTQDKDTRSAYKMTGAKVLKIVIKLAKELQTDELQAMLRPLVADIKGDVHLANAKKYPQLTHAIGVHHDDWTLCKKGT